MSRRTIYRDLQTLRASGIDVRFDPTRGGHKCTNVTAETVPGDASLLLLLKQATASALPLSSDERRVAKVTIDMLAKRLTAPLLEHLDDFRRSVVVATPELESRDYATIFETFEKAIAADLCLSINATLPKDDSPQSHVVQPLRLVCDLETGWRLEGLLVDSHLTCSISLGAILRCAVSDRPITRQLVRSKVEWTIADIEVT